MADSGRHILPAVKKIVHNFCTNCTYICTKSSDRIQMRTCIICTFVHVQNPPIVYKCVHALFVHVQNPPIVYKCVHALFVHLYMYKILRSYTIVYMHYLYIQSWMYTLHGEVIAPISSIIMYSSLVYSVSL